MMVRTFRRLMRGGEGGGGRRTGRRKGVPFEVKAPERDVSEKDERKKCRE